MYTYSIKIYAYCVVANAKHTHAQTYSTHSVVHSACTLPFWFVHVQLQCLSACCLFVALPLVGYCVHARAVVVACM